MMASLRLKMGVVLVTGVVCWCRADTEPNDSALTAESLSAKYETRGAISPVADLDYYVMNGLNTAWGYIALLDTSTSSNSLSGGLIGYGEDGVTVLQMDTGSWEKGSVLALQGYVDGGSKHYIRVQEVPGTGIITPYTLKYYNTIVTTQPEQEPNDNLGAANSTGMTMAGAISSNGDVDYYSFHGVAGSSLIVALNGDPEMDGSPSDLVLSLLDQNSSVITSVNYAAAGGNEVIVLPALPATGIYAYRVHAASGFGPTATYNVGLMLRDGLYYPPYSQVLTWENEPPDGKAHIGDLLTFRAMVRNDSLVTLPGIINLGMSYPTQQLEVVQYTMTPSASSPGYLYWYDMKTNLATGETYSVDTQFRVIGAGNVTVEQQTSLAYFFTGSGDSSSFTVLGAGSLPAIELLLLE